MIVSLEVTCVCMCVGGALFASTLYGPGHYFVFTSAFVLFLVIPSLSIFMCVNFSCFFAFTLLLLTNLL